jgi:hypothetical protein
MKLGKLTDPQFQVTLRKLANQEIPLRTAFALKGIISNVSNELKKYDEVRNEALQRFGEKDETGQLIVDKDSNYQLSPENRKLFVDEMNNLISTTVNVGSVSVKDLGDKCALSASELITLDSVIVE